MRNGLPAIPVPSRPYTPVLSWGADTPEEIRAADTLLVWLVEGRLNQETWCVGRQAVTRSWPGAPPGSPRRRIECPEGRGHEVLTYILELAGDEVVRGVWRRVLTIVWRRRIGRYLLASHPGDEPSSTVQIERIYWNLWP